VFTEPSDNFTQTRVSSHTRRYAPFWDCSYQIKSELIMLLRCSHVLPNGHDVTTMFRRNILLPFSRSKIKLRKHQADFALLSVFLTYSSTLNTGVERFSETLVICQTIQPRFCHHICDVSSTAQVTDIFLWAV
jgi:hypothetical protein